MPSQLITHFQSRVDLFTHFMDESSQIPEVDNIHQLRVSIKRIRSILSLLEATSQKSYNKKKHLKLFKKLFKVAGYLRECHINFALTQPINSNEIDNYINYIKGIEHMSQQLLTKQLHSFNWVKFEKLNQYIYNSINNVSDEMAIEAAYGFVDSESEQIRQLFVDLDNKKLHKIRFHMKGLGEVYKIINAIDPSQQSIEEEISLKETEQSIGEWHDFQVFIQSLEAYVEMGSPSQDLKQTSMLIKDLKLQNEENKTRIIKANFDAYNHDTLKNKAN